MIANKDWLTEDEAAKWLSVPGEAVQEAIRSGELPALQFGSHIRISRDVLLTLASGKIVLPVPARIIDIDDHIPVPREMRWIEKPLPSPKFEHKWPVKKGNAPIVEKYDPAWRGKISLRGKEYVVLIGQCTRFNRGRLAVFFNNSSMCEFVETLTGQGWASIIKPNGKSVLGINETPPALYQRTKIASYRDSTGLKGKGFPLGAAVIIEKDDMVSATHHAVARWLGLNHLPVEPDA
jgi:excisionase family DNA binding protein